MSVAASPLATPILVHLNGVVVRDAAGPRASARGGLQSVTAHLGPGVHAFLGSPEDGTIALCDVIAGVRPPLRGTVLVHSESPWSSAPIRSTIGALLAAPELPEARTVRAAVLQSILALGRAPAEADAVLPALGIAALADRAPRSLTFAEARAIELALALHVARIVAMRAAPPVLVLYEPCSDLALPSTRAVDEAIAAQRAAGACVILATSSPADARRLADTVWILHAGNLVRREPGDGRTLAFGDAEIAVWFASDSSASLRAVASAVSAHSAVRAAYWDDPPKGSGRPSVLRVRGADRDACALAVIDAAASAHVAVEAITSAAPDLGAVRSASLAWIHRMRGAPGARGVPVRAAAGAAPHSPVLQPQMPSGAPRGPAAEPDSPLAGLNTPAGQGASPDAPSNTPLGESGSPVAALNTAPGEGDSPPAALRAPEGEPASSLAVSEPRLAPSQGPSGGEGSPSS